MCVNCFDVHLLSQLSLLNCRHHYIFIAYVLLLGLLVFALKAERIWVGQLSVTTSICASWTAHYVDCLSGNVNSFVHVPLDRHTWHLSPELVAHAMLLWASREIPDDNYSFACQHIYKPSGMDYSCVAVSAFTDMPQLTGRSVGLNTTCSQMFVYYCTRVWSCMISCSTLVMPGGWYRSLTWDIQHSESSSAAD